MRRIVVVLSLVLIAGCATSPGRSTVASPVATATTASSGGTVATPAAASKDPGAEDLAYLDEQVRTYHPDPFANHPESEWKAKLAELDTTLRGASPDQQLVQLSRLIGLLDQHSWSGPARVTHAYEAMFYKFSDGWFTVAAKDPSLIGTRLAAIEGTPVSEVEIALRPLVPYDNESGFLDSVQGLFSSAEHLHGLGIVDDTTAADYTLERPDGTTVTANLKAVDSTTWEQELEIVGGLVGAAPEAVRRRTEPVWSRIDKARHTFLLSYNDYVDGTLDPAIQQLRAALDDGTVDRLVLDMRYLRGGDGSLAGPLLDELTTDARLQQPGTLTVMIGRENVSAGTVVAGEIAHRTDATLVGEQTPARADNFLCECHHFTLRSFGFSVEVPTAANRSGDPRDSIPPDVPMALSSADFFAGKDPVLDAVMSGKVR